MAQVWIDDTRCTGCGDCMSACPASAIALVGDKARVDVGRCSGCGACIKLCSAGAIHEVVDVEITPAHTQFSSSQPPASPMTRTSADTYLPSRAPVRTSKPLARAVTATIATAAGSLALHALQGALQALGRRLIDSRSLVSDRLSQGSSSAVRGRPQSRDTSAGRGRRARYRGRGAGRRQG